MAIEGTSIGLVGIASLLREKAWKVPAHQRSYEWKVDDVNEFLEDVRTSLKSKSKDFFLGSVVATSPAEDGRYHVLDGQQRLATVALLLCGVGDKLAALGDKKRADAVRNQYISLFNIKAGDSNPQLVLNYEDDPFFRKLCGETFPKPDSHAPESHQRLFEARSVARAWIDKQLAGETKATEWLADLVEYLAQDAYVIYFQVPDDANAYLIFETLNDRGIELSIADLLKNYLLGHSQDQKDAVLAAWVRTLATLRSNGGEHLITSFLRHYWASKYEVVREKLLYRKIKERVETPKNTVDFSNELEKNAVLYAAIISPENEFWGDFGEATKEDLRVLQTLGLEQNRPLLLAAMAHFSGKEIAKLVRSLVSWNVRLLVVGGGGGGVMESQYAELAQLVRSGALKSADDVSKKALSVLPPDSLFEDKFETANVSKVSLARYLLRTLESIKTGKDELEFIPNKDPSKLTLEHVLPEKPGAHWKTFSSEDHKAYHRRLGNLCLLTQKRNSDLKSAKFADKKKVYAASTLALTKEISVHPKWTRDSIAQRQKGLAGLAVKAWPL